jgi:hypothetical protein
VTVLLRIRMIPSGRSGVHLIRIVKVEKKDERFDEIGNNV